VAVSKKTGLGADNVLGAWADSHDCYYYGLYLDGDNANKQPWTLHNLDHSGSRLRYGHRIRLRRATRAGQNASSSKMMNPAIPMPVHAPSDRAKSMPPR
jgi:phospholipase C